VKSRAFQLLANSVLLRRGVKFFCAALGTFVAAALLTPLALASDKGTAPSPSTSTETNTGRTSTLEDFYRQRAERNPQDAEAFEGMAILEARRGDYAGAIASYRRVLELTPADHDARVGLGRALAFSGQYDAAIKSFSALLRDRPGDTDALEGLARAQMWAGHPEAALPIFQNLAAHFPANTEYAVGVARAQLNLHFYAEARKTIVAVLTTHPRDREAQMQFAYLDLYEGHLAKALRRFNHLISQDPTDREALLGNARVAYYRGELVYARNLTYRLVDDDPRDVAGLLLLAQLERALHHRREAHALLERAKTIDPHNADLREFEVSLNADTRPTLHTSASFAHEITSGNPSSVEDLSTGGYETSWGFVTMPRSESHLSLAYIPSQSPAGGIDGAVGPSQIVYQQTQYVTPYLTVRSGVGLVRFGPGQLEGIPTQQPPITSAGTRPLGFADFGYVLSRKLKVDCAIGRAALTYTPVSTRLGVMEDRVSLGVDYRFDAKTVLRVEPFVSDDSSIAYGHALYLLGPTPTFNTHADRNRGAGASATLDRRLFRRSGVTVDLGYEGLAYGYSGGGNRPYLGFFNPTFYQRHYVTTHITGKIHGPLGFDFSSGGGVQQVERATPFKPALLITPALTLKAGPRLMLNLGYTHYDSSEALGTLRGNSVRLTTDWRF
jgi:tetratricopeptide (TPR) repeat protein